MDEKIEQLAKEIQCSQEEENCFYCERRASCCVGFDIALKVIKAGYRKESDTAREIYKELFEKQTEVYNKYVFKNDDYDDLETNAIINFSDSLSYEFEKYFKEKYGVDLD